MIDWNSPPWSQRSSLFPTSIWDVLGQALSVAGTANQARYGQDEERKRKTQQDARQRFDDLWRVFQTVTPDVQKTMWPRLQAQAKDAGIDLSGVDFQAKPDPQERAQNAQLLDMMITYYRQNPDKLTLEAKTEMDRLFKAAFPGATPTTVSREISPAVPGGGELGTRKPPKAAVKEETPFYLAAGGERTAEQYLQSHGRQDVVDRLKAIGQGAMLLRPIRTPEDEASFGREIAPYMQREYERQVEQGQLETVTLPNGEELKNLTPGQAASLRERLYEIQNQAASTADLSSAQKSLTQAQADQAALSKQYEGVLTEWIGRSQALQQDPKIQKAIAQGRTLDELINTLPQLASTKALKVQVDRLRNDLDGAKARVGVWQARVTELQGPGPTTGAPGQPKPAGGAPDLESIPPDQWAQMAIAKEKEKGRETMLGILAKQWSKIPVQGRQTILNDLTLHLTEPEKRRIQGLSPQAAPPPPPPTGAGGDAPSPPPDRRERNGSDPQVESVMRRLQAPSGAAQIGAAIGSAARSVDATVTRVANAIRRRYADIPTLDINRLAVLGRLLVEWPKLGHAQRVAIQKRLSLSNSEMNWLARHAGTKG